MLAFKAVLLLTVLSANLVLSNAILIPPPILRAMCAKLADAEEVANAKALFVGKKAVEMIAKPIAVVGGLKAAAVGTGLKVAGAGIKTVGLKMAKDGGILELSGAGVKGAGLGVAALGLRPLAEKVIVAGKVADTSLGQATAAGNQLFKSVGETSIHVDATLDSPLIGRHHKEIDMNAGLDGKQSSESSQITQNTVQSPETTQLQEPVNEVKSTPDSASTESSATLNRAKRAPKLDTEVLKSAFNLVKEAKLEDCVARAVCDLNCNPQGFGQDGKAVFMNMVRLQGSNVIDPSEVKYYQDAASKGRGYSGKCEQCATLYVKCNSKSSDLIKMASHIRMD